MPYIKDSYSLLAEAASVELGVSTESHIKESEIKSRIRSLDEASEEIIYGPESVAVVMVDESYMTDIDQLHPFMKSNGITSIAEALEQVAEAHGLPSRSVGLLVESEDAMYAMMEAAKKKDKKKRINILGKLDKGSSLAEKLKKSGFPVKKKKSTKKKK